MPGRVRAARGGGVRRCGGCRRFGALRPLGCRALARGACAARTGRSRRLSGSRSLRSFRIRRRRRGRCRPLLLGGRSRGRLLACRSLARAPRPTRRRRSACACTSACPSRPCAHRARLRGTRTRGTRTRGTRTRRTRLRCLARRTLPRRAGPARRAVACRAGCAAGGPGRGRGELALRGPHSLGSGTPGGSIWRRLGPPCSDSPGSFAPGQALTTRAARTKSLRRVAFEALRQQQGARPGWPSKVTPNISWVSRSCHPAPAYTETADGRTGAECGTVVRTSRRRSGPSAATCAMTRKPVPGSSTALSQSKYVQPSTSREVSRAAIQEVGGTSTVRTSYDSSAVASGPKSSSTEAGSQPVIGRLPGPEAGPDRSGGRPPKVAASSRTARPGTRARSSPGASGCPGGGPRGGAGSPARRRPPG